MGTYFFSFYKYVIVIYFMGVCHKDDGVCLHTNMADHLGVLQIRLHVFLVFMYEHKADNM